MIAVCSQVLGCHASRLSMPIEPKTYVHALCRLQDSAVKHAQAAREHGTRRPFRNGIPITLTDELVQRIV